MLLYRNMNAPPKLTEIDGVRIRRVKMWASGGKFQRSKGLKKTKDGRWVKKKKHKKSKKVRNFVNPNLNLSGIPSAQRLSFLINKSKTVINKRSADNLKEVREVFNQIKEQKFPFKRGLKCWCCKKNKATLRHHIIQLKNGGKNRGNNIVFLCEPCHVKIHPHLDVKPSGVASTNCVNSELTVVSNTTRDDITIVTSAI